MDQPISPFTVAIAESELENLRRRIAGTRWPEPETCPGWDQGMPLAYTRELADYWAGEYDWRRFESRLNGWPQFRTPINGVDIHFLHCRSPHENALPLIMTHGWPGSIVEFHKVIEPLVNPTAHGGRPEQAFHLVVPSLPGYGFSGKPTRTGTTVEAIARMWEELMVRLGYDRYVAQGGDWGSMVTQAIGLSTSGHCAAIHLNMALVLPDPATMDDLTEQERSALESNEEYRTQGSGYSKQQSTRPQTLAYGLADSPVGQMAWIVEKFHAWTDCERDGVRHPEHVLSKDELLDNVMLYWLNNAAASSARLYWESFNQMNFDPIDTPVGCSIFPREIMRCSRRWAERRFSNLIYWNEPDRGGHFAAFEQPELFVDEVRAAFSSLR